MRRCLFIQGASYTEDPTHCMNMWCCAVVFESRDAIYRWPHLFYEDVLWHGPTFVIGEKYWHPKVNIISFVICNHLLTFIGHYHIQVKWLGMINKWMNDDLLIVTSNSTLSRFLPFVNHSTRCFSVAYLFSSLRGF